MTWLSTPVFGGLVILAALILRYPDRYFGARCENTLPGPRGWPLLGNTVGMVLHRKDSLRYLTRLQARYGEVFTFSMPIWGRAIVINMPQWLEVVRKGDTVKYGKGEAALSIFREFPGFSSLGTEGKDWRLSRRIQQPVFAIKASNEHVVHSMETILSTVEVLLKTAASQETELDWISLSGRIALVIFCKTALSLETDIITEDPSCLENYVSLMDATRVLNKISGDRLYNPYWKYTEKFDGAGREFHNARQTMYDIVDRLIEERVSASTGAEGYGSDFLSHLISHPEGKDSILVRDTLITLLSAGRETVQNALVWSMYELSKERQWFDKMREEAISMKSRGSIVEYDDVAKYHIHLAVLYETLRLWPGIPKNARLVLEDEVLPAIPEHGFGPVHLFKGDYVVWSDYDMMRNEKVWGLDAKSFNPARHLDIEGKFVKPPTAKFHAFGAGPRLCPGAQLAIYEFVAIWAELLPSFDFFPVDNIEREMTCAMTMSMKGSFTIHVKTRE